MNFSRREIRENILTIIRHFNELICDKISLDRIDITVEFGDGFHGGCVLMKNIIKLIGIVLTISMLTACQGHRGATGTRDTSEFATAETTVAEESTSHLQETAEVTTAESESPTPSFSDLSGLAKSYTELPDYEKGDDTWRPLDLRQKDLSAVDLSGDLDRLLHAEFDTGTIWPDTLTEGFDPQTVMAIARTPGLDIASLHAEGITGAGVGIAIIDTPLLVEHSEYKDRIKYYEELSLDKYGSYQADLHGAFMTSIAVGKDCGIASGADVYFISANVWNGDNSNLSWLTYAKAVDRVIELNASLSDAEKIRVISISAAWQPGDAGYEELEASIKRATDAGIFVVTCNTFIDSGYTFCFQGLDRSPVDDKDAAESYSVVDWTQWLSMQREGFASYYSEEFAAHTPEEILLVPMDSLLSAEPTGPDDYIFNRVGGWSAAEPFIAGLYALACQVQPDITPEVFWEAALSTGDSKKIDIDGNQYNGKMVDPVALIDSLA